MMLNFFVTNFAIKKCLNLTKCNSLSYFFRLGLKLLELIMNKGIINR